MTTNRYDELPANVQTSVDRLINTFASHKGNADLEWLADWIAKFADKSLARTMVPQ